MTKFIDKSASLTPSVSRIMLEQGTEYPHSGAYPENPRSGSYLCRRCGLALFRASQQFPSGCGWPAFDAQLKNAIEERPDKDGQRTEIVCARCSGHLGHVFRGEFLTPRNLRHCVNSVALDFVDSETIADSRELILAGGCFWGVEYYLQRLPGVVLTESGYTGGHMSDPGYEQVCQGNTGHYEAVRVVYDTAITDDTAVLRRFFEVHDPEQASGQGPDQGSQYRSAVFVHDDDQQATASKILNLLREKGYHPATQILPASPFWPAESYHQNYYQKHPGTPYCHQPVNRFG